VSDSPLPVAEARRLVLAEIVPTGPEPVRLENCLGRVTAAEVTSAMALQPFDNSAMDGYALRSADTDDGGPPGPLRLVGEARAGHPAAVAIGAGEAAWISTGAMVPEGADAVLPVEDASEEGGQVVPGRVVAAGEHIRREGEDVAAGETVLAAGQRIGAAELAVLAATGNAEVECARRPTLAALSSGDELVPPGEPLAPGQIHDSNGLALPAQAREAGAVANSNWLRDDADATRNAIEGALECDILVVSGGVSVGRHDHVKGALTDLGAEERFWRVAMRPGGPTWFGVMPEREGRRRTLIFGLPGNPVSAMVTFHLFVRPALRAMIGLPPTEDPTRAYLAAPYRKEPGKAHYARCHLELTAEGWRAHLTRAHQGSHVLTSMLGADALALMPAEREQLAAGDQVEIEPLLWSHR
jgi:molybdenum cofactor synthesis domain-containing protein